MEKFISIFLLAFFTLTETLLAQVNHYEMLVNAEDNWQYITPTSEPAAAWNTLSFDDSAWSTGKGGIGYGDNDDNTVIDKVTSVYMRREFTIKDVADINKAYLCIDYDDAFVAYLNGVKIASSGVTGDTPAFDASGINHEAVMYKGQAPEYYKITEAFLQENLVAGKNVLAVHVLNEGLSSSDMSAIPFLIAGIKSTVINYSSVPAWFEINEVELSSSNLPILIIDTENSQEIPYHEDYDDPKIKANLKVINNPSGLNNVTDAPTDFDGAIGIETRGNYSAQFDQKSLGFETRDALGENLNVSLLGMPAENDWILVNNIYDKTFIRHSLSYFLAQKMGYYAPRNQLCEVVINGDYRGIYLFTEKIKRDKNRVAIANLKETDIAGDELTGGYIFKVDYSDGDDHWVSKIDRSERWIFNDVNFIYHDPKKEDMAPEQATYLKDYVDGFEAVLFGDDFDDLQTGYRSYVNVQSFIDYLLINELSHNIDAYKKSKYYYKDKDSKGGLINSGPVWDYDWAWRNYGSSFMSGSGWAFGYYNDKYVPDLWVNRMMEDPYFKNQIHERYYSLRESIFSEEYIMDYITYVSNYVDEAKDRHFKRWDILGKQMGYPDDSPVGKTYEDEVNNLKNFISKRLPFLDREFEDFYTPGLPPLPTASVSGEYLSVKRVFPNPASDYAYVEDDLPMERIKLYNSVGQLVLDVDVVGAYTVRLDLSPFETGIYLIEVSCHDGTNKRSRLIKK